ncbi:ABC transporter permease [Phosphitispora fastidiosa]|uniref:ABC transporter permease n=1 Tax=Phosphitispora fastidiosa TaxID=2837202 RepID=UPI001E44EE7D|nr:peptide/nickel transport system permease protein [Phosphitispora fastidiosa]
MFRIKDSSNYIIAFLIILAVNFFLPRMMPGDPLTAIYGEEALIHMTPETRAELVNRFALNQPLWEQFSGYLAALVRGDLGYSYYYNEAVSAVILRAVPWTLLLVGTAVTISALAGSIAGMESGWRRGTRFDRLLLTGIMFLEGFPDFFIGMVMLIVFGVILNVFPLAGAMTPYAGYTGLAIVLDVAKHLVLPAFSLALVNLGGSFLLARNTMVTTLSEAYIFTARAKGLRDRVVRYRHAGRNSLLPVITHIGIQFGRMVTGALFIETVFSYPGLGLLIQRGLQARDYPVLQGVFLVVTIMVLITNLFMEVLYKKIDPRLKPCISTTGKKLRQTV